MIGLGNNVHLFARPNRREALRALFESILETGPVAEVALPGFDQPMLIVRFPAGGSLSIEFTSEAEDSDAPRFGTWLELRASDPTAVIEAVRRAGIAEVKHAGHPFYFLAPGGQVFTVVQSPP